MATHDVKFHKIMSPDTSAAMEEIFKSDAVLGMASITVVFVAQPDGKVETQILCECDGANHPGILEYCMKEGTEMLVKKIMEAPAVNS